MALGLINGKSNIEFIKNSIADEHQYTKESSPYIGKYLRSVIWNQ